MADESSAIPEMAQSACIASEPLPSASYGKTPILSSFVHM